MSKNLRWKTSFFSSNYKIFDEEKQVGALKTKFFSSKILGILNNTSVMFKPKGFLKQYIEIIKEGSNEVVGVITFNSFMTNAIIIINGTSHNWKYTNAWNTKWHLFIDNILEIKYKSSYSKGKINSSSEDNTLLLTGLFVHLYYVRTMFVMFIALLPVWISALNN